MSMTTQRVMMVTLRPAAEGDRAAIVGLYEHLSPESRHYRFHHPTPRLTNRLRDLLTDLDRADVWLAFDGDVCVGEARISRGTEDADLAVTVADEYQHNGIGRHLARAVIDHYAGGQRCITVSILAENTTAIRMAIQHGIPLRLDGGVLEGRIPIPPHPEKLPTLNRHDPSSTISPRSGCSAAAPAGSSASWPSSPCRGDVLAARSLSRPSPHGPRPCPPARFKD